MARPTKIGLDYFPLDCNIDDNLELIEAEFGLQGFAIVVKIWQKIYSNGYYIEWDEDAALLFSRKINTELSIINSVINSCFKRNLFDEKLYKKYKILTSSGIQKRYLIACQNSKRRTISFIQEFKLVNSEFTGIITELTSINSEFSTQKKVKESKVKESKGERPFIPEFSEFKNYALENQKNTDLHKLELKFKSWVESGWVDGKGNKIKNWKSKLLNTLPFLMSDQEQKNKKQWTEQKLKAI